MLNRAGAVRTPLKALILAAALLLAILTLGSLVGRGWGGAYDRAILLAARDATLPLAGAAVNLTALGGGTVLTLVVLLAAGGIAAARARWHALLLVAATFTGGIAVDLLKAVFARARPALVEHLVPVGSASFPSAHAANSAIVFLTIGALGARLARTGAIRRYLMAAAILTTLLVGASRVVLGVHWPSDVLGGWLFGAAWALAWWVAAEHLLPRKRPT